MIFQPVVRTFFKVRSPQLGDEYLSVGLIEVRDDFELQCGFEVRVFRGRLQDPKAQAQSLPIPKPRRCGAGIPHALRWCHRGGISVRVRGQGTRVIFHPSGSASNNVGVKPGPIPGRALLNRVIDRVYASAQSAPAQEAYELGTITLRLLSLLRRNEPATLDTACYAAFGCSFSAWQDRNQARLAFFRSDLRTILSKPLPWPSRRPVGTESQTKAAIIAI